MKKFLSTIGLLLLGIGVSLGQNSATATYTSNEVKVVRAGASYVSGITLTAGAAPLTVYFYDSATAVTNYVTAAYITRTTGISNIVTTNVTTTGITNIFTNSVLFTSTVTNAAATNNLPAQAFSVGANLSYTFDVNDVFVKAVVAHATTNGTVTIQYKDIR